MAFALLHFFARFGEQRSSRVDRREELQYFSGMNCSF
jgi:hypothetical protein